MTNLEDNREYYEHEPECLPKDLGPVVLETNARYCYSCAGVFEPDGKTGVAITSKRFDKPGEHDR